MLIKTNNFNRSVDFLRRPCESRDPVSTFKNIYVQMFFIGILLMVKAWIPAFAGTTYLWGGVFLLRSVCQSLKIRGVIFSLDRSFVDAGLATIGSLP